MPLSITGSATAASKPRRVSGGRVSLDDQPLRGIDPETWPRGCADLLNPLAQIGPQIGARTKFGVWQGNASMTRG